MYFPKLSEPPQKRVTVDRFLGLDRRRRASEGALAAMENLTGAHYPALAVRSRRSAVGTAVKPGGLTAKDALIWVDGTALYVGGIKTGLVLTEGLKQLVSMGAYLVIWPDKKLSLIHICTSSSPGARCTACSGTLGSSAGWGTSPSGGWIC